MTAIFMDFPRILPTRTVGTGGLFVLFAALALGCGGKDWQADTYPATGKLTINGEPAAGAVVELKALGAPPDIRNSIPWGIVQEDGTYQLSTYRAGDGIPPGEYAVTITWPWNLTASAPVDRLNKAYASAERSPWKITIVEGPNELPPIEITGAKIPPQPKRDSADPQ